MRHNMLFFLIGVDESIGFYGFLRRFSAFWGLFALIRHGYAVPPSPEGKALGSVFITLS